MYSITRPIGSTHIHDRWSVRARMRVDGDVCAESDDDCYLSILYLGVENYAGISMLCLHVKLMYLYQCTNNIVANILPQISILRINKRSILKIV